MCSASELQVCCDPHIRNLAGSNGMSAWNAHVWFILAMNSRILLAAIVCPTIAALGLLSACSPVTSSSSRPEPPQAADPSAVTFYGCGVNKTLRIEAANRMRLSSLLDEIAPLPQAVNSLFIRFPGNNTHHYFALSQISPTNAPGTWVITNGVMIILAHTDQFPIDAMKPAPQ
jgi:hypothetical protein